MSRIQKIILIVVLILVLGFIGYLVFFKGSGASTPENQVEDPGTLPELPSENGEANNQPQLMKKLSDNDKEVFGFWVNTRDDEILYIDISGVVFSAQSSPNSSITSQSFSAINKVQVGPEGEMVLVSFGDPKSPSWGVYDTIDSSWRPMPGSAEYLTWGKSGSFLIGIISDSGGRSLVEINLENTLFGDGSLNYSVLVQNFQLRDIDLYWDEDKLIIAEKPASFYSSRVWELDPNSSRISLIVQASGSLKLQWEKEQNVVFTINKENEFFILNKNMQNFMFVPFTTYPSKCSASTEEIYCFVPKDFPENQNWEDYDKGKIETNDDLFVLNRVTQEANTINIRGEAFSNLIIDAKNPLYSNGKLYFINNINNSLYSIDLADNNSSN